MYNLFQFGDKGLGEYWIGRPVKVEWDFNDDEGKESYGHIVGFTRFKDNELGVLVKTDQEETIRFKLKEVKFI